MSEFKRCTRCLLEKPLGGFYQYTERDPHKTGRRHAACKACQHAARAAHRAARPQLAAANARRSKLKRLFGITPEAADALLAEQGNVCAVCKRPSPDGRRLHVDHCHKTRRVRGLLCHDCNRGIGMFRDSAPLLHAAANYLAGCSG